MRRYGILFAATIAASALSLILGSCSDDRGTSSQPSSHLSFHPLIDFPVRDVQGLSFTDSLNGWAAGMADSVYHTADGGQTWEAQPLPEVDFVSGVMDMQFVDVKHGWAVGSLGTIWHTSDGGDNWIVQRTTAPTGAVLEAVHFIDSLRGWVIEGTHNILRTVDAGLHWESLSTGLGFTTVNDIFFINDSTGWLIGSRVGVESFVMRTDDGGESWVRQPVPTSDWLSAVTFASDSLGWICGDRVILTTGDAGASWVIQYTLSAILRDISFFDESYGCAIGDGGVVLYTGNGGRAWSDYTDSLSSVVSPVYMLFRVAWLGRQTGWITGDSLLVNVVPEQ